MKSPFFSLFLSICLFFLITPLQVGAHLAGQPPFFLMNGKYAGFYPVYSTSLPNFPLPQDMAPETYLVNQPIDFAIDAKVLPFPPDVVAKTTFSWDFGDGAKASGLKNTHAYTKPGSYLLTIHADYAGYSDPNTKPLLQAVLLNVVPDKNYKLPKATITVNGKQVNDPLNDTFSFPSGSKITLSAEKSVEGTSPIATYFWDVGDGQKSDKKTITVSYKNTQAYVFPMLRVKDKNGFISDAYVQIENSQAKPATSPFFAHPLLLLGLGNLLILGTIAWFVMRKK